MIRLTVEQLYLLQSAIQGGGQAHTSVTPLEALGSHRLIVAWARTRSGGDLYLSIWKDKNSWKEAIEKDRAGEPLPYDFINDEQSIEYTHAYPVAPIIINNSAGTVDQEYVERQVRRIMRGEIETVSPGAADSGHPEFGVSHGE